MRILIVSDTHGNLRGFEQAVKQAGIFDMLLHLGDVEGDEDYIESIVECPVYIVAGNNDFYSDLPEEILVAIGNYKVFMSHGHGYYVSRNTRRLKQRALEKGANIAMYGHTHRPDIDESDGIITINPGSLTYPRQEGRRPSYIIMTIAENSEIELELHYL